MIMRNFLDDEGGTASIEFVFIIPIILTIFMASFEASLFMARNAMLERSVDIVVRDLRLGSLEWLDDGVGGVNGANLLKEEICSGGMIVTSVETCVESMTIWMQPVNTATFDMPDTPVVCVDRTEEFDPLLEPSGTEFAMGADNDIMLMRICLKEEPLFPTTLVGAGMIRDEVDGNYALMTTTVFVNEPG
ncbi:MAG: hypothetical protein B7Z10_00840 [Rhodobacterales bacterium 32-66-7]|nr:MAG: hypothetical protein B7Z10_00840 [Rhodobacterales bacterium 32-66-7]OZA13040.1 MAG: hypothetical protein B7Y02_06560 [Rhodobacterales bacterium 17-64-5]